MNEEWRFIQGFPGYSVSNWGSVRNDENGRMMARLRNQAGIVNVSLTKNHVQHKRSVSLLVAEAFIPVKPHESFATPINLDGDRGNNVVDNLMWRPRWFAIKYFRQFRVAPAGFTKPIEELESKERFRNSWEAALRYGLIDLEIVQAILNNTQVWPTNQKFRILRRTDIK